MNELDDVGHDLDRVKFLSDGVFAIAMTLLIFNLKLPDLDPGDGSRLLALKIREQLPALAGFLIAFYILGVNWIIHTRVVRHLTGYDRGLLFKNLAVLLLVALMPYGAAMYAKFSPAAVQADPSAAKLSWMVYASIAAIMSVCMASLWRTAIKKNLVDERVTPRLAAFISARIWMNVLIFVSSIAAALYLDIFYAAALPWLSPLCIFLLHRYYERNEARDVALPKIKRPSLPDA
jgi:uncharacterized membrane protein